eukprot:14070106-Alexandrium_andersonii.AAC.1
MRPCRPYPRTAAAAKPALPNRPRAGTSAAAESAAPPACSALPPTCPSRPRPRAERAGAPPWAGAIRMPGT